MLRTDILRTQEISRRLSNTLDCLGYSSQMIEQRKSFYRELEDTYNNLIPVQFFRPIRLVGSKAEGSSKPGESHTDVLSVVPFIVGVDESVPCQWLPFYVTVLKLTPCIFHPGHFKLLLVQQTFIENDLLNNCFRSSDTEKWLSGPEIEEIFAFRLYCQAKAGATCSVHRCCQSDIFKTAIPCICPDIVLKWIHRHRKYDWPPADVIRKISKMQPIAVPSGIRGCPDESLEWRLCFHEIEFELTETWNDTQTKLYKLLKIVKTNTFNEPENQITSFIMKNIVFWLSECYPLSDFRPENLVAWYVKAMRLLKRCVKYSCLPHYLFPLRNLIVEKIPKNQKQEILEKLNDVIRQGPQVLFKCESLQWSLAMTPAELMVFKEKRDKIELLESSKLLLKPNRFDRSLPSNGFLVPSGTEVNIQYLMASQWPRVVQDKLCSLSEKERDKWLLS